MKRELHAGGGTRQAPARELTRRQLGALAGAAALAGATRAQAAIPVVSRKVMVPSASGSVSGVFVQPVEGRHPALAMWARPGAGARRAAEVLAGQGWAVLVLDEVRPGGERTDERIHSAARAGVAWLTAQDRVELAGASTNGDRSGLAHGYSLRAVAAARPRFSLATRAERQRAGQATALFAVPPHALSPAGQRALADAAYAIHRLG